MINERIINYFKFSNKIIYDLKYNSNDKFLFIQKQYNLDIIKLNVTNKNFNVKLNIEDKILENQYNLKNKKIRIILVYDPKKIYFEINNITDFNDNKTIMLLPIFNFEIKEYNFKHKFLTNDIDLLSVDNKEIQVIYLFKMLTYSLFTYN